MLRDSYRLLGTNLPLMLAAMVILISPVWASEPSINEWCPVMKEERADPAITTVYRDRIVAFCCDTCLKKFLANPARYERELPQFNADVAADTNEVGKTKEHGALASEGHDEHQDLEHTDHVEASGTHGHEHYAVTDNAERDPLLGRLHPVVVHFPLAGLPLALLGYLIWWVTGHAAFSRADVPPLFVATLGAIAAVVTGNIAHDSGRFSEALHVIVERHQLAATSVMVLAVLLSIFRIWRWNRLTGMWRWIYGCGLLVACGLLGLVGFLGGSLVFGPDHLAW